MPMQPSTQVTHIPDWGWMDPSVRFLVRVAAEVFVLDSGGICFRSFFYLQVVLFIFKGFLRSPRG